MNGGSSYSWHAWKFGMKREDLNTKLHDQYNTITLAIQDPDAFYLDVCEISQDATNVEDFHRKLELRKQHRLDQLNSSLQSASVEIIGNPELIGTNQWQHAVQLFRTRSFDSLVRYFASYLPEDHAWYAPDPDAYTPFFDELDDSTPILTHEPASYTSDISTKSIPASHLPPSPRSLTMCSDSSGASTPARASSLCEAEPEHEAEDVTIQTAMNTDYEYDTSQWDDPDTPTTPLSELSGMSSFGYFAEKHEKSHRADDQKTPSAPSYPDSASDIKTPTLADTSIHETPASKEPKSILKYTPLERRSCRKSPALSQIRRLDPGRIHKRPADSLRMRLRKAAKDS